MRLVEYSRHIMRLIDAVSEWSGRIVSYLVFALMFAITYEVVMRYLFRSPTVWSYDLSYMLGGTLMAIGGAYVLKQGGHVRVDIIYLRLSERSRIIIDLVFACLLFLPMMLVLFWNGAEHAWVAWITDERSSVGHWHPPMYPFRAIAAIAILLLLLQGFSWVVRNVLNLICGQRHAD